MYCIALHRVTQHYIADTHKYMAQLVYGKQLIRGLCLACVDKRQMLYCTIPSQLNLLHLLAFHQAKLHISSSPHGSCYAKFLHVTMPCKSSIELLRMPSLTSWQAAPRTPSACMGSVIIASQDARWAMASAPPCVGTDSNRMCTHASA